MDGWMDSHTVAPAFLPSTGSFVLPKLAHLPALLALKGVGQLRGWCLAWLRAHDQFLSPVGGIGESSSSVSKKKM